MHEDPSYPVPAEDPAVSRWRRALSPVLTAVAFVLPLLPEVVGPDSVLYSLAVKAASVALGYAAKTIDPPPRRRGE